jgi:hypothetical protein
LTLVTLFAALPAAASAQAPAVLHIKITLTDAAGASLPVPNHPLLISDNPATATPRRVVTAADGTADVRLRAGNYTVESDEPFGFNGKGYQWTETLDVPAGRDVVLQLNARNAEVVAAPPVPSPTAPKAIDSSLLPSRSKDAVVSVWTPESRGSGFIVDTAGLVVTNQSVIASASAVEVQVSPSIKVAARVLAADPMKDVAVLWIDPAIAASAQPVPLDCARIPLDGACEAIDVAKKAMAAAPAPVATRLPVEPSRTFPDGALDAEVQRRAGNLNPYRISSADFDIAFFTPVLTHNVMRGRQTTATSFGD